MSAGRIKYPAANPSTSLTSPMSGVAQDWMTMVIAGFPSSFG
jgi:hypothetical protein